MRKFTLAVFCAGALAVLSASATAQSTDTARHARAVLTDAPGAFGQLGRAGTLEKGAFLPRFGNYFDTGNPGWGLDIQRVGDLLFVVWFIYRADGTPIWYVAVGELTGMTWNGTVDVFSWDSMAMTASATNVGTMSITWSDETTAQVSWVLNGQPGGAGVEFASFGSGPTLADLTGHYFPFFTPGWGFTLLTQGDITVITIYFYRNGEPIWAQGVATTPGFSPDNVVMNYFFAPGLCPECLGRKGAKAKPLVDGLGTVNINYNPGLPVDVSLFIAELFDASPVPDTFDDIIGFITNFLGNGSSSSIVSAYVDNFDENYGGLTAQLPGCIPIELDPGSWEPQPVNTSSFDVRYFNNQPQNGYFAVFDDPACTSRWRITGPDLQLHDVSVAASFTSKDAVQIRFGAMIPEIFDDGENTCDEWFGVTYFGTRDIQVNGNVLESLEIHGTGATRADVVNCSDGFRFYSEFGTLDVDFTNEEFEEDPDAFSGLRLGPYQF